MTPDGDEDNDDVEDGLSPEFRPPFGHNRLRRSRRAANARRYPHPETAERMSKEWCYISLYNSSSKQRMHPCKGRERFRW